MPKVYISQEQKDVDKVCRLIKRRLRDVGVLQTELATKMGISAATLSNKLKTGCISIAEFMRVHRILHFTDDELAELFGNGIDKYDNYFKEILYLLKQKEGGI